MNPSLYSFALISLVIAVTPGPGVAYILARSLSEGRWVGFLCVAGGACGNFINLLAVALGLSFLLSLSPALFWALRLAGSAYLVYLGITYLRRAPLAAVAAPVAAPPNAGRVFAESVLLGVFNPKTALFFAAFLPPFLHGPSSLGLHPLSLSLVFTSIAFVTDMLYMLLAGFLATRLPAFSRLPQLSGCVLILLGVVSLFSR